MINQTPTFFHILNNDRRKNHYNYQNFFNKWSKYFKLSKNQKIDLSLYKDSINSNYTDLNTKEYFEEANNKKSEVLNLDKKEIIATLKKEIGGILKLQVSKIDQNKALVGYGFDSLMSIELVNKIDDYYKIKVNPNILKEKNTIESLSDYLIYHIQTIN